MLRTNAARRLCVLVFVWLRFPIHAFTFQEAPKDVALNSSGDMLVTCARISGKCAVFLRGERGEGRSLPKGGFCFPHGETSLHSRLQVPFPTGPQTETAEDMLRKLSLQVSMCTSSSVNFCIKQIRVNKGFFPRT